SLSVRRPTELLLQRLEHRLVAGSRPRWERREQVVLLVRAVLRGREALCDLDAEVRLPGPAVEGARGALHVTRERLDEVRPRADLLLRVGDPERLVEHGVELDLAAPPVVVVLPALATEEEPAVVDLAAAADDRHPRAL